MDSHFDLNTSYVFRAMRIARMAMRMNLMGVLIEPIPDGGAWIVGTDGNVMLIARDRKAVAPQAAMIRIDAPEYHADEDEQGDDWDWQGCRVYIPAAVATAPQVCPVFGHASQLPFVYAIAETAGAVTNYPTWRNAIGANKPGVIAGKTVPVDLCTSFNVALLNLVAPEYGGVRMRQAAPNHSMLVTTDDPDVLGVIATAANVTGEAAAFAAILTDLGKGDILAAWPE